MSFVRRDDGTITLVILLMLVVFALILGASIQFISRQSHETTNQEVIGKSFGLADTGAQNVLWILRQEWIYFQDEGGIDQQVRPVDYLKLGTFAREVRDDGEAEVIGKFEADVTEDQDQDYIKMRIRGQNLNLDAQCQTLDVEYRRDAGGKFQITDWEYVPGVSCAL
jgi:hypothetical protein